MCKDKKDIFVHPVHITKYENGVKMCYVHNGITLRDHFAGEAMQRLSENRLLDYETVSRRAYGIADAMLKQREL